MNLSTKDAAEYLAGDALKQKTLENWRSAGKGPRFLKIGGRVVYPVAELDAFKATCLRSSTAPTA